VPLHIKGIFKYIDKGKTMKIRHHFIPALLLIIFAMPAYAGDETCWGKDNINLSNRFSECSQGDIITVATIVSTKGINSINDIGKGGMHLDEVNSFCSFDHPIVEVGKIQLLVSNADVPLNWFNCVYLGQERKKKFPAEMDDLLKK
jgi:hypothetical protein